MAQASAPRASATAMSEPCRIPESTSTEMSGPTMSRTVAIVLTGGTTRSSWRPPWLDSCTPSAPTETACAASCEPSGPLTTSRPGQRARNSAMSSQVMAGLNSCPVPSMVTAGCPAKLAKSMAGLRSIRIQ